MKYLYILIGFIAVMSVVTFITYGIDKAKAKRGAWRISEKALLLLSAFGGCLGGILAMVCFRHKTKHWYFWAVNLLACAAYATGIILFCVYVL